MTNESKAIAKLNKRGSKLHLYQKFLDVKGLILNHLPASLAFIHIKFLVKTEYKLKRESFMFFLLANRAYGADKARKCDRMLRIAFKLLGSEFPRDYANLLRFATKSTLKVPSKRRELSESILLATKQLEQSISDATGWYQLSRGLFSLGYFRAALVARENSLDLSIAEGKGIGCSATVISRAIEAHLERRNFAEVELLMAYSIGRLSENICKEFNDYFDMMQNKCAAMPNSSNSLDSEAENLFRELITNKSVALVGPGSPSGNYGNEIDSADTVVRIKYVGREHLPPQEIHGNRCDINYFGHSEIETLSTKFSLDELGAYLNGLKMTLSFSSRQKNIGTCKILNIDQTGSTYRTNSYAGIRVLYTILKKAPDNLTIFGIDFYANQTDYSLENQSFLEVAAEKLGHGKFDKDGITEKKSFYRVRNVTVHDAVSNFCFAQNLYKAGLFEIEPFGKSILELTPYQYVERLEEILGDW